MPPARRPSVYEQLRPHLDASDLIRRLGLHEARRLGSEAYCKPLCHDSASGESLQINLHTGRWNCKACQNAGYRGDLIQLVEYVRTGGRAPSHGAAQGSSVAHREALEWLCSEFGVPFHAEHVSSDGALDVVHMFAMAAHEHLLRSPDVLAWIQERWGFDIATVESHGIGYMPSPLLPAIAAEAEQASSHLAFRSSGLGWYRDGRWHTRFEGRVVFPYLEHGRAVYLIGRATRWTPPLDDGRAPPKYHKLSVHSEQRPFISESITNNHLYNEPVMSGATTEVLVAEGVADAVAFSMIGAPVVSPVTISFNATDLERFVRKCKENGIQRVWLAFDNELSGSGNWGARRAGRKLAEHGLVVKIITLPLGPKQLQARDEVVAVIGPDAFARLERMDPRERKELILTAVPDDAQREWVLRNIDASKIDGAEWVAERGAAAADELRALRRAARDVVELEIEEAALTRPGEDEASAGERAEHFADVVALVARIDDRLARLEYSGAIAKAAGRSVTKAEIARRVSERRREDKANDPDPDPIEEKRADLELVLVPPGPTHSMPAAPELPPAKTDRPNAPAAPQLPTQAVESEHTRLAPARKTVQQHVEAKMPEEVIGEYIAQTITKSMGFTAFRTPDDLYLVRGNQRVPVGLDHHTPQFNDLLWLASSLTAKKASHRAYIAAVVYFLGRLAQRAQDVSWSYVAPSGEVYFPVGDAVGTILRISPGLVSKTRMAEARVPAVAGAEFEAFEYSSRVDGVDLALDAFRLASLSEGDRLVLVYWLVCLPVLRRVGTIPIVRIQGGSGSGKTRALDAASYLVNGRKTSSVPTAAALVSRMSVEMLTVDDNRETRDVTPALLGTLLQATHLGAREKRRANSDTGTVVERICGALLMNGIEPIHDGMSELASRMLLLNCSERYRAPDSPTSEEALAARILAVRDAFWSTAVRRCAAALDLDQHFGERLGYQIERVFGATKIGRLSAYLRMMYLAWVAGLPEGSAQVEALEDLDPMWLDAFQSIATGALDSLIGEELTVSVVRYVMAYAAKVATAPYPASEMRNAFGSWYVEDKKAGDAYLGPVRASQLARLAREAGRELNAPASVSYALRAGQLEQRLLDGRGYLEAAGIEVRTEVTSGNTIRWTFRAPIEWASPPDATPADPGLGFGDGTGAAWSPP